MQFQSCTVNVAGLLRVDEGASMSASTVLIDATTASVAGTIHADGRGFAAGQGDGKGCDSYHGGSHGGTGGMDWDGSSCTQTTYGEMAAPVTWGSGAGRSSGGAGGGAGGTSGTGGCSPPFRRSPRRHKCTPPARARSATPWTAGAAFRSKGDREHDLERDVQACDATNGEAAKSPGGTFRKRQNCVSGSCSG